MQRPDLAHKKRYQDPDRGIVERRGRSVLYTPDVTAVLKDVWEVADRICGELLHPVIAEDIDILIRDGMWPHDDEATGKLCAMSAHPEASHRPLRENTGKAARYCCDISLRTQAHHSDFQRTMEGPAARTWTA